MTVIKSEFYLALNQVATERGISADDVLDSIKMAVLAAYKKDYLSETEAEEADEQIEVKIDKNSGETRLFKEEKDITPAGFGRIAAQTARQVILQRIREAEKKNIIKHYVSQVGTIIKGRVIRFDGRNAYFDLGKAEGLLPQEEQIRGENYRLNDTFIVYIKEIKDDSFGNSRVIVSRADPKLVEELFKKEVPEISNGTVKVYRVVREPGERAKISVFSDQSGVDPVGACVGQKGIRVKAVTDELGGEEKIDIIQYNEDDIFFIREAMSPATVGSIDIEKGEKKANVTVEEDQVPLAIGRNGVNVNLASKLTDYEIDIVQVPSKPKPEKVDEEKSGDEKAIDEKDEKKEDDKLEEKKEKEEEKNDKQEEEKVEEKSEKTESESESEPGDTEKKEPSQKESEQPSDKKNAQENSEASQPEQEKEEEKSDN